MTGRENKPCVECGKRPRIGSKRRCYSCHYVARPDLYERRRKLRRESDRRAQVEGRRWEQRPENQLKVQWKRERYERRRQLKNLNAKLEAKGIEAL